jgi:phage baseplate assembly protein W
MSEAADFVGRGLAFPFSVDHRGSLAMTNGEVNDSIQMVLMTAPGERVMRPDFGCRIWDQLFEPINANTMGLMAVSVREALSRWEPRIELDDVRVEPDPSIQGAVKIELDYRIKTTNDRRNLVFPFYTIPREDES